VAKRGIGLGIILYFFHITMTHNEQNKQLISWIASSAPGLVKITLHSSFLILTVNPESVGFVATFLKKNQRLRFDSLLDVWATDYISNNARFELNYLLLSVSGFKRVVIRVQSLLYTYLNQLVG
jgi:NADH:ubiquinone oxidoreductase subunit C